MSEPSIPESWIKGYVDRMLALAAKFPDGKMREAVLSRADHAMDLVKAYRERADHLNGEGR
jgi:hypothetical protein